MCEFVFMLYANVESSVSNNINQALEVHRQKRDAPFSTLGPLKANERKDLNCAVKEYLLIGGYRLTAMTFCEEVSETFSSVFVLLLLFYSVNLHYLALKDLYSCKG